jgi:hypothetical protein
MAHTPGQAVSIFQSLASKGAHDACVAALEKAAQIIEDEAKRVIGTYEYGWPPLQPATVARKGADTPLYETGEMRDSIEHYVDAQRLIAQVGSNDPKALWHELGTVTIPARSFLMGAAMRKEREIHELTGVTVHGLITRSLSTGAPVPTPTTTNPGGSIAPNTGIAKP